MLGPKTKVTLGVACASAVFLGSIAVASARYVGSKFDAADVTIRELAKGLEGVKADRFTLTAASEAALRTAIENPGLRIPDPRDPSKVFVVDVGRRTP